MTNDKVFKNLIAPVQAWLLSQGKCVGCSLPLSKGKVEGNKVVCKCKRIYIKDGDKYRRARLEEV